MVHGMKVRNGSWLTTPHNLMGCVPNVRIQTIICISGSLHFSVNLYSCKSCATYHCKMLPLIAMMNRTKHWNLELNILLRVAFELTRNTLVHLWPCI